MNLERSTIFIAALHGDLIQVRTQASPKNCRKGKQCLEYAKRENARLKILGKEKLLYRASLCKFGVSYLCSEVIERLEWRDSGLLPPVILHRGRFSLSTAFPTLPVHFCSRTHGTRLF